MNGVIRCIKLLSLGLTVTCAQQALAQDDAKPPSVERSPKSALIVAEPKPDQEGNVPAVLVPGEYNYRGVLEGEIKSYAAGLQIDMRGDAIPKINIELLKARDKAGLSPILDALSKYNIPIYDLDVRYVPKEERAFHGHGLIEVEQFIEGQMVGYIRIAIDTATDTPTDIYGLLINPNIPELDSSSWVKETDAIQMATDVLMQEVENDANSEYFLEQVRTGKFAGKRRIDIDTSEDGIIVTPVYEVNGRRTIIRINLFDGSMETLTKEPMGVTTEVWTNVCRLRNVIGHDTCTLGSVGSSNYPQIYHVYLENTSGNRFCGSTWPYLQPVQTQCNQLGYREMFDVVTKSENYLSQAHPTRCCDGLGGPGVNYLGNNVDHALDVQGGSLNVTASNAGFDVFPGNKAMIHVGTNFTGGTSTTGWRSTMSHEWAHAYQWYFGNANGLGGGVLTVGDYTGNSILEGMADFWSFLFRKENYWPGTWAWDVITPTGTNLREVSGTENWTNYVHASSQKYNNGKIFAAQFMRMEDKGILVPSLRKAWLDLNTTLSKFDSNGNDGMQGTSLTNVWDFAANMDTRGGQMSGGDRNKMCRAWKTFNLKYTGWTSMLCPAQTPNQVVVTDTCIDSESPYFQDDFDPNSPATLYTYSWNNKEFLSFTEVHTKVNSTNFDIQAWMAPNQESVFLAVQFNHLLAREMKVRSCRVNPTNPGGNAQCSGFTLPTTVDDTCQQS